LEEIGINPRVNIKGGEYFEQMSELAIEEYI
jgi:hypothetical protein